MKSPSQNSKMLTLTQQASGHLQASRSKEIDPIVEQIKSAVDRAIVDKESARKKRKYLGASSLGDECSRKLQYRYIGYQEDKGRGFTARTFRIFQVGHDSESIMARYITDAGFDLRTEDRKGRQFGFSAADDQIKGHIDGVVCGGPIDVNMNYPCLWEAKTASEKKFNEFVRMGVTKANPVYAAQIALYQAYMNLTEHPCLFTVYNKNNSEIYYELVPFDPHLAQRTSDKAVTILTAAQAGDILPRIAQSKDFFLCKMCDYRETCWKDE